MTLSLLFWQCANVTPAQAQYIAQIIAFVHKTWNFSKAAYCRGCTHVYNNWEKSLALALNCWLTFAKRWFLNSSSSWEKFKNMSWSENPGEWFSHLFSNDENQKQSFLEWLISEFYLLLMYKNTHYSKADEIIFHTTFSTPASKMLIKISLA